jgi:hypothetical protein
MFARTVAMLTILAITVVTTVGSGHAARMIAVPDHLVHVSEMMHAQHNSDACGVEQHCPPADAKLCAFVCAGLPVFLPSPGSEAGPGSGPTKHARPSETIFSSRSPELNERPPKPRLL